MSFDHDSCNTGLVLGLGLTTTPNFTKTPSKNSNIVININQTRPNSNNNKLPCTSSTGSRHHHQSEPSLTLSLSGDNQSYVVGPTQMVVYNQSNSDQHDHSGALSNSFSSGKINVKRERDMSSSEEDHYVDVEERITNSSSRFISDEDEDGINARKKLRLTKEQSALLENNFKQHSTLNPKLKQALAKQLNLTPRQVEVWFQNRRARTKLKQTEVDCEFLKKCCETLTDENRRLQKELQELKALKLAQPFYMHMPAATLTMCPSCERIATDPNNTKVPFSKPHHFFNPFTNNSAAC